MKPYGIIPAVVTPFDSRGELDEDVLREMLSFLIEKGVHGVFTVGTAGEYWALSLQEKKRIYEITVEVATGKVPAYVGTGANSTRETIELTQMAKDAGADCVSIITPSFVRLTQDETYRHYADVAEAVEIPIVLYDNRDRTGNPIATQTAVKLAKDYARRIVGIKDSSGDLSQTQDYLTKCPPDFAVIMGRDTLIFPALVIGAAGAIAATSNIIPELVVEIYEDLQEGRVQSALQKQRALVPVRQSFTIGSHPAAMKAAIEMMAIPTFGGQGFRVGAPRPPVSPLTPAQLEQVRAALDQALAAVGS